MAILAPEVYSILTSSLGGSDALLFLATKRPVFPSYGNLQPEIIDGLVASLVGPPLTGEAMYALYLASVDAAEPLDASILGGTDAALPLWAGLTDTVQAAWDAAALAAQ